MFERYTEKARRVIFFGRYEASQYGSPSIETEYLLLGLLREDPALIRTFLGPGDVDTQLRAAIEERITQRERISTSVEMPLTDESQKILNLARDEADRLGHRTIGTGHLLLGMLGVRASVAGELLHARGLKLAEVRERLAKITPLIATGTATSHSIRVEEQSSEKARLALDGFLAGLKWHKAEELIKSFAEDAQLIDVLGNVWNHEEICKNFGTLFAPYAKKNAAPHIEKTFEGQHGQFAAIVLWKNAVLASLERIWIHRMTVVLIREDAAWRILLMQVTPVQRLQVESPQR
jgi:hypothetical protein